ncbi:MAG: dihydroneopterin aldolase [Propionibacteriaceae bacterium]|nr:dihydroneopterin aldolase [Propionibacteriaceae bacterium]
MRGIDVIAITGLSAVGFHGVFPEERRDGQRFVVDVELGLDVDTRSDDLAGTVNYAEIADAVCAEIAGEPCQLIETLAGRIAERCLAAPLVQQVTVTVHKPQAPVPHDFTDISVTITRRRS